MAVDHQRGLLVGLLGERDVDLRGRLPAAVGRRLEHDVRGVGGAAVHVGAVAGVDRQRAVRDRAARRAVAHISVQRHVSSSVPSNSSSGSGAVAGQSVASMVTVSLAVRPPSSVTVNVAVWVPGSV
jgi:NAD(P)H-hydrate repair Nnr-like enzyme with NAD(P)H-hydrate epimerase domain